MQPALLCHTTRLCIQCVLFCMPCATATATAILMYGCMQQQLQEPRPYSERYFQRVDDAVARGTSTLREASRSAECRLFQTRSGVFIRLSSVS